MDADHVMDTDGAGLVWRKAGFGDGTGGDCVEIADTPAGGRAMRDSKLGEASPVLRFTEAEWRAFLAGVKDGEFDS